jgi:phosphoribosylformylglycinamidine (FGAM) synthase PurS component
MLSVKDKLGLGVIIALSLVSGYFYLSDTTVYVKSGDSTTVEIEKEVSELDKRIKTAQNAKIGEIEVEAKQAYQDLYDLRMVEIENTMIDEYQVELEARKASNTEAVSAY